MESSVRVAANPTLAAAIAQRARVNVFHCYQCKRCTSGCPVAEHVDLGPHQVMRALQFGRAAEALRSRTAWLCIGCQACTSRCPQDLDVAAVMETVRLVAQEQGLPPAVPSMQMFSRAALRGIRLFGRMYELGLMAELYARLFLGRMLDLRHLLLGDLPLAARMFLRRKLRLWPQRARSARPPAREAPGESTLEIGYYPGCSLHGTAADLGLSTRAVAQRLGISLVEPQGWVCCGTTPAHTTDHYLATLLPMRNLALFHAAGQSCVTMPCVSCFQRTRVAIGDVRRDPGLRAQLLEETGYEYHEEIQVEHLLETLEQRVGLPRIASLVVRPLHGLRVACYYGCLLTRPRTIVQHPHPEYPQNMDRLAEALGAEPLDWSYKTDCCGAALAFGEQAIMQQLAGKVLRNAREVGAEAVVVACPLCHANLDLRQDQLDLPGGPLPILYVTQLLGLAFGLRPDELGLGRHLVDPLPLLRRLELVSGATVTPNAAAAGQRR